MELRLTIVTPERVGALVDVVVTAPPGTPLGAALPELRAALGITEIEHEISCQGIALDSGHPMGTPPLVHGAVVVLGASDRPEPPLLEAQSVAGPDAGSSWPLRAGVNGVGRSSSSRIRPEDEDVSRGHAEIVIAPGGVSVRDHGSTNGTWVDGARVEGGVAVEHGQEVTVGATTLVVGRVPRPLAAIVADGAGHIRVNRRPDLRPTRRAVEITFPPRPDDRTTARLPWPALVLPLVLAVPLAVFWHQAAFLAFALMSPLLIAGQFLYDRRSGRRETADRLKRWQEVTARADQRLTAAVAEDAQRLREQRPDAAEIAVAATTPTDDVWRRSPGDAQFLGLRVGRGPEASCVRVRRPAADDPVEVMTHPDVPVIVDLPAATVLGVSGPRPAALGLARSLLGQVAVLHAPSDVRISVLVADPVNRAAWQWIGRLPHHVRFGSVVDARRVVVLDGAAALRSRPDVSEVLAAAADGRGSPPAPGAPLVICLAGSEQELPVECGATITLEGRSAMLRRPGVEALRFGPDLTGTRWAERVSRGLAPLREASAAPDRLPTSVQLTELIRDTDGFDPMRVDAVTRHWRRAGPRGPTALTGVDAAGAVRVDLRRDGPHVLVGGTTGAGKSELLQTLIAGLALDSGPDEVSFLLVDYKGGAAFRDCLRLPHVTGLITDLDPRLAARALASLRAELRRREQVLATAGAVDIDEYRASRAADPELGRATGPTTPAAGPALPRLVVVVDEFRVLAEELPDFVGGLMRVASVGRSLGVHLVLATQRPAGIVSPEISANTNLRIALRLRDEGDSRDLVGDPSAAHLPADVPGRALLRSGGGQVRLMQAARVRGRRPATGPEVRVRRAVPHTFAADDPAETEVAGAGPTAETDLHALVRSLRAATDALRVAVPAPPWLPPLPARVGDEELAACAGTAVIGVKDVPDQQSRAPLAWCFDGRHLAVAGGPRSGRTTTARTLTQALAAAGAHVYVIDGSGVLGDLEGLPGVEGVVAAGDLERCERLLARLRRAVEEAASPVSPVSEQVVLVVDGWETLLAAWNELHHGRLVDELTALLRDGPASGVQAAVTGGRSLLTGAVSSLLAERLVLRFADPGDAVLAGVRAELVSRSARPGRAIHLSPDDPDGHEVQIALLHPVAAATPADPVWAVPRLPVSLTLDELWARAGPREELPVGIGGAAGSVVTLPPAPLTVVLGPAGSGRTTTLRGLAAGLRRRGRSSVLVSLGGEDGRDPGAPARVAEALRAGVSVLVDDARAPTALGDSPADRIGDLIAEHLAHPSVRPPGDGVGVVLACSPADVLSGFRGLPVNARGARQGLVLGNAGPAAAEVFGTRVVPYPGAPPGRATLVRDGRTTVLQLPTCEGASACGAAVEAPHTDHPDVDLQHFAARPTAPGPR